MPYYSVADLFAHNQPEAGPAANNKIFAGVNMHH